MSQESSFLEYLAGEASGYVEAQGLNPSRDMRVRIIRRAASNGGYEAHAIIQVGWKVEKGAERSISLEELVQHLLTLQTSADAEGERGYNFEFTGTRLFAEREAGLRGEIIELKTKFGIVIEDTPDDQLDHLGD